MSASSLTRRPARCELEEDLDWPRAQAQLFAIRRANAGQYGLATAVHDRPSGLFPCREMCDLQPGHLALRLRMCLLFAIIAVGFIHGAPSAQTHLTAMNTFVSFIKSLKEGKCNIKEEAGCSSWNHLPAFICALAKDSATWASSFPRRTLASWALVKFSKPAGDWDDLMRWPKTG